MPPCLRTAPPLLLALLLAACDTPGTGSSPLELCAIGWWNTGETRCPGTPTCVLDRPCGYGDCSRMVVMHLSADHRATVAQVDWSRVHRRVELVSGPERGTWSVRDRSRVLVQLPTRTVEGPTRCDAAFLLHGDAGYMRIFYPDNWDRGERTDRWTREDPPLRQ